MYLVPTCLICLVKQSFESFLRPFLTPILPLVSHAHTFLRHPYRVLEISNPRSAFAGNEKSSHENIHTTSRSTTDSCVPFNTNSAARVSLPHSSSSHNICAVCISSTFLTRFFFRGVVFMFLGCWYLCFCECFRSNFSHGFLHVNLIAAM